MAPSPELGQPKAPDKAVSSAETDAASTDQTSDDDINNSSHQETIESKTTATCVTTTTSSAVEALPVPSSLSAAPHINKEVHATNPQDVAAESTADLANTSSNDSAATAAATDTVPVVPAAQNLGNLDDIELKNLLDEAITYKRPKDREHKSKMFKELLLNAEQEDKDKESRSKMSSGRHTGSLQDLVDAVRKEHLLDNDHVGRSGGRHHNSRQKKYSSVSSRQREGGSLPSNVNCKECPYEQSFLSEFKKRKNKLEKVHGSRTAVAAEDVSSGGPMILSPVTNPAPSCGAAAKETTPSSHTIIEIEPDESAHLLAHDSLAQGTAEPMGSDTVVPGTSFEMHLLRKLPRVSVQPFTNLVSTDSSSAYSIDKTVNFSPLLMSTVNQLPIKTMQLNNYAAVNSCVATDKEPSCVGSKLTSGSSGTAITTTTTSTMAPNVSSSQSPLTSITLTTANGSRAVVNDSKYMQNIQIIPEPKHIDENGNAWPGRIGNSASSAGHSLSAGGLAGGLTKSAKKKKVNRADRKTTVLIAKEIPGNRGDDDILKLLSFIENNDRKSGNNLGGGVMEKHKRSSAGNKKESLAANKLKKSNSMEELKSNSKMEDEAKLNASDNREKTLSADKSMTAKQSLPDASLTLRTKVNVRKKNAVVTAVPPAQVAVIKDGGHAAVGPDTKPHPHQKRGERRSWGTEELTYLGDSKSAPAQAAATNTGSDEAIRKSTKDDSYTPVSVLPVHGSSQRTTKSESNRNANVSISSADLSSVPNPIGSSMSDLVSASSESAEFHVVTKKKKPKKRSALDDSRSIKSSTVFGGNSSGNDRRFTCHSDTRSYSKYGPSSAYQSSHDRDSISIFNQHGANNFYHNHQQQQHCSPFTSGTSGKAATEACHKKHKDSPKVHSRRKSTSSVPPSEKSDSSDLDSVHSLPIESTLRYNACGFTAISSDSKSISDKPTTISDSTNQSSKQQTSPSAQISYADIARITNVEKSVASAAGQSQHSGIGLDKWPSVSKSITSEVNQPQHVSLAVDVSSGGSKQLCNSADSSKPNRPLSFASDKPTTTGHTDPTSTATPPVTFSQMLAQQDHHKVSSEVTNTISATSADTESASTSTSSKPFAVSTEIVKQKSVPQKSRHIYEQYPELSKTVKSSKHSVQQSESADQGGSAGKLSAVVSEPVEVKKPTKNPPIVTIPSASASAPIAECPPSKTSNTSPTEIGRATTTTSKKNNKKDKTISARPAVIILDNHRPSIESSHLSFRPSAAAARSPIALTSSAPADAIGTPHSSPLRFGDFNDDVLRLLDQDADLMEPIHYVVDSPPQSPPVECCSCAGVHSVSNRQQSRTPLDLPKPDNSAASVEFLDTSDAASSDAAVVSPQLTATIPKNGRPELKVSKTKVIASMEKATPSASVVMSKSSPAASVSAHKSGTSDLVFAALEAIAQQNQSAVNTVANAKEVLAELTVRYVAPPPASLQNLANYNHDKIVNFVGLAWQDIMIGGPQYYTDGQ